MENLITFIYNTVQSPYFLCAILCFSMSVKLYYLIAFASASWQKKDVIIRPVVFLLLSIFCALVGDVSWFAKLTQTLFYPISYYVITFFIRLAWAALIVQYLSLSLFLQSLTNPHSKRNIVHFFSSILTAGLAAYFAFLAFLKPFDFADRETRLAALLAADTPEFFIMRFITPALIGAFTILGTGIAIKNILFGDLPKLVKKQVKLFTLLFLLPYFLLEFVLATWFTSINEMLFVVSTSTLMLAMAVYYCLHSIMKMRVGNTMSRVQGMQKPHVIDEFKNVLKELSNATNEQELMHITHLFFKEAFGFPNQSVHLTIREQYPQEDKVQKTRFDNHAELFLAQYENDYIHHQTASLLVRDEIAFNQFYSPTEKQQKVLSFLSDMQADIFLPIYSNKSIVGYIWVDTQARRECVTHSEQDAMCAFATYLGNVINLLQHRNVQTLLHKEKKLKDSLYIKHQEINHYKESVHSFLRHAKQKHLGIIFYKNNRFTRANNDAQLLIPFDPNLQEGNPITKALKEVAQYVETFSTPHSVHVKTMEGHPLLLSGVPHLQNRNVIITVSYPDISDVILKQMHLLENPNDWDYLLYLSSTRAGAEINAFIPSNEERLLNIKIAILKAVLSKRSLFLNVPEKDSMPLVSLTHQLSLREKLHTISLSAHTQYDSIGPTLFGHPHQAQPETPLFQKLLNGTLYIKDVQYLDLETQKNIAEHVQFGWYRLYDSKQIATSSTRIICSSHQSLSNLVHQGRFSTQLYTLLKKETITIPSMMTLSYKEQESLISGFTDQLIHSHSAKNLFTLSHKEHTKILDQQPASLAELKDRVEHALLNKVDSTPAHTPSLNIDGFNDPDLVLAGRLGKQALKNEHIMQMLWQKFKNQNKIAQFLGVNRSSVNRRFKAYSIGKNGEGIA